MSESDDIIEGRIDSGEAANLVEKLREEIWRLKNQCLEHEGHEHCITPCDSIRIQEANHSAWQLACDERDEQKARAEKAEAKMMPSCTCDCPGFGECPLHGAWMNEQALRIKAEARVRELVEAINTAIARTGDWRDGRIPLDENEKDQRDTGEGLMKALAASTAKHKEGA